MNEWMNDYDTSAQNIYLQFDIRQRYDEHELKIQL